MPSRPLIPTDAPRAPTPSRPWLIVAALLGAAALLPLLSVRYVPTLDGPWHAFNARVVADFALGRGAAWQSFYAVDLAPRPYWGGLVVLAVLGEMMPPETSLRLLFLVLALALPAALVVLRSRLHGQIDGVSLLAFPFAFGLVHHMGLLGLCLGAPLLFAVLAYWWPRRREPRRREAAAIGGALLLLWLCHLFVWAVGYGALLGGGLLLAAAGRASWRGLRRLAIAGLPGAALAAWYLGQIAAGDPVEGRFLTGFADLLLLGAPLVGLTAAERLPAALVSVTLVALGAATLARRRHNRRPSDGELVFGAGAGAAFAATVLAPRAVAGGTLLEPRLAWFFLLFLFLAVAEPAGRRMRLLAPAVAIAFAVAHPVALMPAYRAFDRQAGALTEALRSARSGERVKVARFDDAREISSPLLPAAPISSVAAWSAAEQRWIPLDNAFPGRSFSPIRFRSGAKAFRLPPAQGSTPRDFVGALAADGGYPFDVLVTWRLPPAFAASSELRESFRLRASSGPALVLEPIGPPPISEP